MKNNKKEKYDVKMIINAYICSENYTRRDGHLTAITMNTGDTIWTLRKQNVRFQPTKFATGTLQHSLSYDDRGRILDRVVTRPGSGTLQSLTQAFEDETGNMSFRRDRCNDIWDTFEYDSMNRLEGEAVYGQGGNTLLSDWETLYDGKGNILSRTDAGDYGYGVSRPYAVSELTPSVSSSVPMRDQHLHFNAMQLPDTISEIPDITQNLNFYTYCLNNPGDSNTGELLLLYFMKFSLWSFVIIYYL